MAADIPEAAITAAAEALRDRHEVDWPVTGVDRLLPGGFRERAREVLAAAGPHLNVGPPILTRVWCPICDRHVIPRRDGAPGAHLDRRAAWPRQCPGSPGGANHD